MKINLWLLVLTACLCFPGCKESKYGGPELNSLNEGKLLSHDFFFSLPYEETSNGAAVVMVVLNAKKVRFMIDTGAPLSISLFCQCLLTMLCFSQSTTSVFLKADSLYAAGSWKEAALAYRTGLKTSTAESRCWYRLGACYQLTAQYPQAIEAYKKGLSIPSSLIPPILIKADLAKTYAMNKDSTKALDLLSDMVGNNSYINFADLDTASAYRWLKGNERFTGILSKARLNAYPCLSNPRNHEFDFWFGEWTVYQTGTDYHVGKEKIENASGSCMILEN